MTRRQWCAVIVVGSLGTIAAGVAGAVLWFAELVDRLERNQ